MGNTILGYSNRVRYAFIHSVLGYEEIQEPRNWKEDNKELVRNSKESYAGIFGKMSEELVFTGTAKAFINQVYSSYGANTDLRLIKDAQDPDTDEWYRVWDGQVDLTTLVRENSVAKAKFNADTLETIVKARNTDKFELEREEDLFGNVLEPLKVDTVELLGRKILLESLIKVEDRNRNDNYFHPTYRSNSRQTESMPIPIEKDYESDPHVTTPTENEIHAGTTGGSTGLMFYLTNDVTKDLNISINFDMVIREVDINNVSNPRFEIQLVKYGDGANYNVIERQILYSDPDPRTINGRVISYSGSQTITMQPDESLSLIIYMTATSWGTTFENGDFYISMDDLYASISISEDSHRDATQSNILLPHEVMDRLMTIITGRTNAFYSKALGRTDLGYAEDGIASLCGMSHGHWKRNFSKGDDLYKPITTTIKDFITSYGAVWGLGVGIEKIGFQERLRIEERSYFYNRNVTIRLGDYNADGKFVYQQVNALKRTAKADSLYSEIFVGSAKFEPYEEIQGLDEFNTQSTFSTVINKIQKTFSILSVYRRDATGGEIARRMQKVDSPTEDTKYDEKIFLEDLKRSVTSVFQQRKWQDDFSSEPTGIFDPGSATNLRLSQVRMILRHGWQIATCLLKDPTNFIRFGSTEGNGNLESELIGETQSYKENTDIANSDLERAIHEPDTIEFQYKVSDKLLAHIEGKSIILGEEVENKYGLVEFMNDEGGIERGHLESLKPNGEGIWVLTKYHNLN